MAGRLSGIPDWRNAEAYRGLTTAERPALAWEWLRRDPDYRRLAAKASFSGRSKMITGDPAARPFGLHAFEDPELDFAQARPVWTAQCHAQVLAAAAVRAAAGPDSFDLRRLSDYATVVLGSGLQHLLLSDGRRSLRVDVEGDGLLEGAVVVSYRLRGFASAEAPLLVLRRLVALRRSGRFPGALDRRDARMRRLVLILRAYDGLSAGANQRQIAGELLSRDAAIERWRVQAPTIRSRAQRLVRGAQAMAAEGWFLLLRGCAGIVREGADRRRSGKADAETCRDIGGAIV